MRIVVDMQSAQSESRYRGIGRYTMSLVKEFIKQALNHEIILILNAKFRDSIPELMYEFRDLPSQRIRIFDIPVGSNIKAPLRASGEALRHYFIASLKPDLVLVTGLFDQASSYHNVSIGKISAPWKTAVIHYDLIPYKMPSDYLTHPEHKAYYYECIENLKRADIYFCISNYTKLELEENIPLSSKKVFSIGSATEPRNPLSSHESKSGERVRKRLQVSDYILYVPGGFDKRKNFERLIKAYAELSFELRSKYKLVIGSKVPAKEVISNFHGLATTLGLKPEQIVFTDYLNENELQYFYENAALFVFPSLHEGFGLPVLEAMNRGCPVIGSSCTSIPEVIGNDSALFDPNSVSSISQKIKQCLEDKEFATSLIEHHKSQVKNFSWSRTATKMLHCIEQCVEPTNRMNESEAPQFFVEDNAYQTILDSFTTASERNPTPLELAFISGSLAYNLGSGKLKQMLVDISALVVEDSKTGIQRVVRSLLSEFIENPPPGYAVLPVYFDGEHYRYADKFVSKNQNQLPTNGTHDAPADFWQDDIFLSLDLTMHLWNRFDALHLRMRQRGVKLFFIIYDLLPLRQADWFVTPGPEWYLAWIKKITENADGLFCISEAVAIELREWIEENPLKRKDGAPIISSFHLGADIENSKPSLGIPTAAKELLPLFKQNITFLMVSTLEPRKGHAQTLRAFEKLWSEGHEVLLVLVGKKGWKVDELAQSIEEHPMLNQYLFWLKGVSDEYLTQIYQSASCLISSSEGEGFGLPLIEAAHHKIPIIARDMPVFREVAKDYAFYFSSRKSDNLANAIKEWMKLFEANLHPKSEGMPCLNWKQSADQLLNCIFTNLKL